MSDQDNLTQQIKNYIADYANISPDELNDSDHLEDDLMINLDSDLAFLIINLVGALDLHIPSHSIKEFVNQMQKEPEKAIFAELVAFLKEEIEF